ncbi:magnesium chelatase subunit D [Dyadobacter jejuensis]|uniref:Mg-protoporphyrin IX chelatase n=1 Tax=Dyadobacter jejuensis TaxID=1082580 RepID=A0A316ABM8_9BACT|nr:magnesium chelatase subunit D family protein [Dyadobacter jejuensis]PWJ55031.1 magnesium chelatase subunit D [Dyadobacter jejuensis]
MYQYPFSAIVGQHQLKQALILCAINPSIGGVLIKGEKGTAKSTAVRGLSAVMPPIRRIAGSPFNLSEAEYIQGGGVAEGYALEQCPLPLVNVPLGVAEDRLLGSLDLETILSEKKKQLLPGLLAEAHRGLLYIDEVNLLADHLVDVLLDVAASGVNRVQKEGLSETHPAQFVLIGTMNPEEGNLRPQFLDRFGMMVEVQAQMEVTERTEVVRRRMAFEADPEGFINRWQAEQNRLAIRIREARASLPTVSMPEGLLTLISELCIEWSVASLRADIVLYKTALTLAAWNGKQSVTAQEVREAAELVLVHRRGSVNKSPGTSPTPQTNPDQASGNDREQKRPTLAGSNKMDASPKNKEQLQAPAPQEKQNLGNKPVKESESEQESVFAIMKNVSRPPLPSVDSMPFRNKESGRSHRVDRSHRGSQVGWESRGGNADLALVPTLQEALVRNPEGLKVHRSDLRFNIRAGKAGKLILFVVDASGSMAAQRNMEFVKGSVLALLQQAYEQRDRVAVIAFRGVEAFTVLEPTADLQRAETALGELPTGGRTPLAAALKLALEVLGRPSQQDRPLLICLSDGKANVPLPGGGDPWQQSLALAREFAHRAISALVIDTEQGYSRMGRATLLASALQAPCVGLDSLCQSEAEFSIHEIIQKYGQS